MIWFHWSHFKGGLFQYVLVCVRDGHGLCGIVCTHCQMTVVTIAPGQETESVHGQGDSPSSRQDQGPAVVVNPRGVHIPNLHAIIDHTTADQTTWNIE